MRARTIQQQGSLRLYGIAWVILAGMLWASPLPAQNLPEGKAKETVASVCSQCHSLRFVTDSRMSQADWEYVVTDMVGRGAPLMEDEIQAVIDYLATTFPRQAKVNVNTAGPKDLQFVLAISPLEAEAIVAHREKNGKYASAADLQKVSGVDARKLDAAKDKIEF